jgi:asparagine synthase (glutamine-hydrolysing)
MSGFRAGLAERSGGGLSVTIEPGGRAEGSAERVRCLIDGVLFDLDRLADLLGTGELEPERLLAVAYERWGEEMIGRLRGNFALAIHDGPRQRLLLACDQLGARSLFFHSDGSRLRFAPELADLIGRLPTRPPPDDTALVHWLASTGTPAGRTLYQGVGKLDGGRLLRFDQGGVDVRRYWAPSFEGCADLSPDTAIEATREALAAAVRRQLPDRDRCGVLLSGGLDSTSVAALAHRQAPARPLRAYSAVFPEHPSIDESNLIDEAATDLGLEGSRVEVRGGSMVRGALEYMQRWGVPLPAPNHFLWQPLLERAASDGTELILDGEGGDELWRFSPYLLADRLRSGRLVSATRLGREMLGVDQYRGWRSLQPYLRLYGVKGAIPAGVHSRLRNRHPAQRYAPDWFSEHSAATLCEDWNPWGWKRLDGPRWWSFMADLLTGVREKLGVGDYLRRRAAMAGLRDRHPLIDVDLVEFALRLPPTLAVDPVLERPLLRRATAGLIPDSIRLRGQKSYFTALFHDCLAGRDLNLIRELLDDRAEVGAYVDLDAVGRQLLADPPAGGRRDRSWPWSVWRLITAECWLRSQRDGEFVAEALDACEPRPGDLALTAAASAV